MSDSLIINASPRSVEARLRLPGPPVVSTEPRKVVVRLCAGFECRNAITTHRVRQNIHGHREYCSLVCYARWSPGMREAISRFPDYEQSPSGLESLIIDLKKVHGVTGAAQILGFSRSTVSYWSRKFAFFRQFAGQSPEDILSILAATADERSLEEAAKLIFVNPKTLQRAILKIPRKVA